MLEISISVDDKSAIKSIDMLRDRIKKQMPRNLDDIGRYMIGSIDKNFKAGGQPTRWAPLKASTIARRRGGSSRPLMDTGTLKNSIGWRVTGNAVSIAPSVAYGKYHQTGTRNMVARPFIMIQDEDVPRIVKILMHNVVK